jgi:hypothetical protein
MIYGIEIAGHSKNRIDNALSYKINSLFPYEIYFIYSHDNPDPEVIKKFENNKIIIRPNLGHDYGASRDFFQRYKDRFDRFIFLNDDIIFIRNDWLNFFHSAFEMSADVVSPCVCKNHFGENIPRCCFWAASRTFLFDLPWPEPLSKADAYYQEMNLLPKFMKTHKKRLFQVGNGEDLMYVPEYPPGRTECIFSSSNNLEIQECPI